MHIYTTGIADNGNIGTLLKIWNEELFDHVLKLCNHQQQHPQYQFIITHCDILQEFNDDDTTTIDKKLMQELIQNDLQNAFLELNKKTPELFGCVKKMHFTTTPLNFYEIEKQPCHLILDFAHIFKYKYGCNCNEPNVMNIFTHEQYRLNVVYLGYFGNTTVYGQKYDFSNKILLKTPFFKVDADGNIITYYDNCMRLFEIKDESLVNNQYVTYPNEIITHYLLQKIKDKLAMNVMETNIFPYLKKWQIKDAIRMNVGNKIICSVMDFIDRIDVYNNSTQNIMIEQQIIYKMASHYLTDVLNDLLT
jgi:hypothetical protein